MLPFDVKTIIATFITLFTVIDPLGTVPVFISVTKKYPKGTQTKIAVVAVAAAFLILSFFLIFGRLLLKTLDVPLSAFRVSGGVILFLFALSMIFGDSKQDEEAKYAKTGEETAIFPLAVPFIAGPGAIMAVIILADAHRFSISHQAMIFGVLVVVLILTLVALLAAQLLNRILGTVGASIFTRVMGLILAAIAASNVLIGIKQYFF